MVLALHMITGAVLAGGGGNAGEAIVLGLTSHYFLDSIPHIEYKIENIVRGNFKAAKEFAKIFLDLLIGLAIVFYLLQNKNFGQMAIILTGAFFAILPDGLVFLDFGIQDKNKNIFTKFLGKHGQAHKKIHSTATNKILTVSAQIIVIGVLAFAIIK